MDRILAIAVMIGMSAVSAFDSEIRISGRTGWGSNRVPRSAADPTAVLSSCEAKGCQRFPTTALVLYISIGTLVSIVILVLLLRVLGGTRRWRQVIPWLPAGLPRHDGTIADRRYSTLFRAFF